MRTPRLWLVVLCLAACGSLLMVAPLHRSQVAHAQAFAASDALTAATVSGGKLVFNFTLTVNSAVPKNGIIACEAHANINNDPAQNIAERAFATAHLVSGNQWACTVNMPYAWTLTTPSTDKAVLGYRVSINEGLQVLAANSSTTASIVIAPLATRETDQLITSISIPLNGATTTETVHVTL